MVWHWKIIITESVLTIYIQSKITKLKIVGTSLKKKRRSSLFINTFTLWRATPDMFICYEIYGLP